MKPKTFTITVNGDRWKYSLLNDEQYLKVFPEGHRERGSTDTVAKTIHFRAPVQFGTVLHELFHAYCHYLYLNSSNISFADHEEIIAEMLEEKVLKLVEQANKMLAKMTGGQNGKKDDPRVADGNPPSSQDQGLV